MAQSLSNHFNKIKISENNSFQFSFFEKPSIQNNIIKKKKANKKKKSSVICTNELKTNDIAYTPPIMEENEVVQIKDMSADMNMTTSHNLNNTDNLNFKTINYIELIPLLVQKVQLQDKEISELKTYIYKINSIIHP